MKHKKYADWKIDLFEDEKILKDLLDFKAVRMLPESMVSKLMTRDNPYARYAYGLWLWAGKGYFGDGNWAYVQGKRMERRRMISELFNNSVRPVTKLTNLWHIFTNIISDILFGYGESMFKMIVTYILTVFFFAWVFAENVNILEYTQALAISLKNMAGMDSETIRGVPPLWIC